MLRGDAVDHNMSSWSSLRGVRNVSPTAQPRPRSWPYKGDRSGFAPNGDTEDDTACLVVSE